MGEKVTIGFEYTNEFGDSFQSKSTYQRFAEISDPELIDIGRYFNTFVQQIGFIRNNPLIFMEDISEEEYDVLSKFLNEYRNKEKVN